MEGWQVIVAFNEEKFEVLVHSAMTFSEFQQEIELFSGVDAQDQKLFAQNIYFKKLSPHENVWEVFTKKNVKKVKLMGQTKGEKDKFKKDIESSEKMAKKLRIKNDLPTSEIPTTKPLPRIKRPVPEFGFAKVKPLDGFSDRKRAKAILKTLASDPGVLFVMEFYRWKVPVLSELFPEGKVGVSDVCLMGLNVNQGQEIKLRVRTDDLLGFRKYASIIKVFCHELAHNRFPGHGPDFLEFMSEIETKLEEGRKRLEGTNLRGEKVSAQFTKTMNEIDQEDFVDSSDEEQEVVPFSGVGHAVGTDNNRNRNNDQENQSPREKAAAAARKRMKEKKEE